MADLSNVLINHYEDQYFNGGLGYMNTPEYQVAQSRMKEQECQLLALLPGIPTQKLHLAVNEFTEIAEDHLLSAECHGFRQGFRAALRLRIELERWALSSP